MSKKGAKAPPKEAPSYEQRDVVLGKVRGFPPWPGMIVDPETVPPKVMDERPTKKSKFYCVQFFPAGDYAWLVAKDISKLQTHEIESYINEPYKKSGDLLAGYRIALDPKKWEDERGNEVHTHEPEEEAPEVDELDSDGAGSTKNKSKLKKRKRDSDVASTKPKKPSKPKKDSPEATKKKTAGRGKKNGSRSKALVESEDEGEEAEGEAEDEDAGPSKKTSPPPAKKAKRDKGEKEGEDGEDAKLQEDPEAVKVREWRHRLQKAFLGKTTPEPGDMPALDTLFNTVESYDKITIQYLQFSKIGKVMRHITLLSDDKVPRDDEFKFRERAKALVDLWHQVLNKPNGSESGAPNGAAKMVKADKDIANESTVTEAAAAINLNGNEKDVPMPEEHPTSATGEVDADAVGDASPVEDVAMAEA